MAAEDFIPLEENEDEDKEAILNLVADVSENEKRRREENAGDDKAEPQSKILKAAGVNHIMKMLNDSIRETDAVIEMSLKASKALQDDQNRVKFVSMQLKKHLEDM